MLYFRFDNLPIRLSSCKSRTLFGFSNEDKDIGRFQIRINSYLTKIWNKYLFLLITCLCVFHNNVTVPAVWLKTFLKLDGAAKTIPFWISVSSFSAFLRWYFKWYHLSVLAITSLEAVAPRCSVKKCS